MGRRTRRVAERLAAALAGGAVLLAAAAPALATAPGLGAAAASSSDYPATVVIRSVAPPVVGQNDTIVITGQITNSGGTELKSAHAGVRGNGGLKMLSTRSEIALVASRNNPSAQDGTDLDSPVTQLGNIGPGQSADFALKVSPADLKISKAGVYELAVDVWSANSSHALGIARTFLPYNVKASPKTTPVTTLWPLTHAPELVTQTVAMPDNDQTQVLRDDQLATELAPGGRLDQLVALGRTVPGLTWVVDPDLLDTVYAMTKPYRVQKPGSAGDSAKVDNTVAGTGKDSAIGWLARLRLAVAGAEVVALPYADPDLASIAHGGAGLSVIDSALSKAGTAGQVTAEGRLGVDVKTGIAWPYQGYFDQQIAATTRAAGDNLVLVNSASLPEAQSLDYTPGAARPIGNGQTAVVADHTVSDLFQVDLSTPQAQSAAKQRFLAETMAITMQQPQSQRGLLVMPSRTLSVSTAKVLADALAAAKEGSWISPVGLNTIATAAPDPEANVSVPGGGDYPGGARNSELSREALTDVVGVQTGLDQLLQILTQPQRVRGPFSAAMLRSLSTQWRDQAGAGNAYRAGVQGSLNNLITAVKVPQKSVVTLSGDNGTILVSVKNDLNQAVGNLQLRLTSGQLNRLNVLVPAENIVVDANTSRTLRFPAAAQTNGSVQMTAQLWTTGPGPQQPYGSPVTFTVEVTSVTQGVLYVIGGGVVLILLAAVRFSLQRKKRAAEPDGESDAGADPGADGDPQVGPGSGSGSGSQPGSVPSPGSGSDSDPGSAEDAMDPVSGSEKVGP